LLHNEIELYDLNQVIFLLKKSFDFSDLNHPYLNWPTLLPWHWPNFAYKQILSETRGA